MTVVKNSESDSTGFQALLLHSLCTSSRCTDTTSTYHGCKHSFSLDSRTCRLATTSLSFGWYSCRT
jgi:hypothetical protein